MIRATSDSRTLTPSTIANRLRPVFKRHGICRALLFGSIARGDASRHSDVDLILVQRTSARFLARYEGLYDQLCAALPEAAIEPLIYTPEELSRLSATDSPFVRRALQESVCLYESE